MANVSNPRFPHCCRIVRYSTVGTMEDQVNIDDPMSDECLCCSTVPDEGVEVIYCGECRGFNRDTTSDNGDVNTSYRWLSLPVKQDEWTADTMPREGDKVELQRYGYTEYGLVIDRRPSNLGTHILWKYVRN